MSAAMVNRLRSAGWAGSLAVALTLVLLPLGFCLGQGSLHDGAQHVPCPALCAGALASLFIAALLGLGDLGRLPLDGRRPIYAASFVLSDPPPKLLPIS
jgi:hypothetical protein